MSDFSQSDLSGVNQPPDNIVYRFRPKSGKNQGVVDDTQGTGDFCLWVSCGTPNGNLPVPDVRFARFRCHLIAEMGKLLSASFFANFLHRTDSKKPLIAIKAPNDAEQGALFFLPVGGRSKSRRRNRGFMAPWGGGSPVGD